MTSQPGLALAININNPRIRRKPSQNATVTPTSKPANKQAQQQPEVQNFEQILAQHEKAQGVRASDNMLGMNIG